MKNKPHPRAGRKPAKKLHPLAQVDEIVRKEREAAARRQAKAGITEPVRTGFKRAEKLPPEINAALDKIWRIGHSGDIEADQIVQRLYSHISRGLPCLTPHDIVALAKQEPAEIRALAHWLTEGKTLDRALWAVRQEQEKRM